MSELPVLGAALGAAAVRAQRLQAMAARAAGQPALVQALLVARVQALAQAPLVPDPSLTPPALPAQQQALGRLRGSWGVRAGAGVGVGDLAALQRGRTTWERLSAGQRVQQALAQVPAQAGPLNTSHLIHRALGLMQTVAPGYLQQFVPYVDTLLWLQGQQGAAPTAARAGAKKAAKAAAPKKSAPVRIKRS